MKTISEAPTKDGRRRRVVVEVDNGETLLAVRENSLLPGEYNLYPASALAALAAERDALRTALEDLSSEAVEIWEYPADYPQIEHANELIAKYKAAALTKGQP